MSGASSRMKIHAFRRPVQKSWLFDLNNTLLTFLPDDQGRMVIEVTDPYQVQTLLARPHSFRELVEAPPAPVTQAPEPDPPVSADPFAALRAELHRSRQSPSKGKRR